MKKFMKDFFKNNNVLILFIIFVSVLFISAKTDDNIQTIGGGTATVHKAYCVDQGNPSGSRPCLRWNSTSSSWEASNNGSDYTGLGAPTATYFTHTNDPDTTHAITAGNREYVVIASSAGGTSTVTLPAANTVTGQRILIRRTGSNSHDNRRVLITSTSNITDASSSIDLWRTGAWIDFYSDGTNYIIVDKDRKFGGYIKKDWVTTSNSFYTFTGTQPSKFFIFTARNSLVDSRIQLFNRINMPCHSSDITTDAHLHSSNINFNFSNTVCSQNRQIIGVLIPSVQITGNYSICLNNFSYSSNSHTTTTRRVQLIVNNVAHDLFRYSEQSADYIIFSVSGCIEFFLTHSNGLNVIFRLIQETNGSASSGVTRPNDLNLSVEEAPL